MKKKKNVQEEAPITEDPLTPERSLYTPLDNNRIVISSGSTLLDLAISGSRVHGGGIPGGIMVEIFGPPSSGKSCLLMDICASAQAKGGEVRIADPEARLDKEYAALFGLQIPRELYKRPNTVSELYGYLDSWAPKDKNVINVFGADSIAALSTDLELGESGDKRGQRKAKELSELCRKISRKIAHEHLLVVFTNQERQSDYGKTTPGGFAVPYHASLRIRIYRAGVREVEVIKKKKVEVVNPKTGELTTRDMEFSKVIGIESEAAIVKSSISEEHQTAPLYIISRRGIDDVRANLVWLKKSLGLSKFLCADKEFTYINQAIRYIEDNNLEAQLREMVITTWEDIDSLFRMERKNKVRF
ncbi:MAG: hypothetical protein EHM49_00470 [Deltaproteobacteria bacterium]|nr:MAG: hypothetical protein EHM49_00470 [Deltaproteobacteria bacterium]